MTESSAPTPPSRPLEWLWELVIVAAIAVPATALFWLTDLDLVIAGLFYFPNHVDGPWPLGHWWLWEAIYQYVPLAGAAVAAAAATVLGLATIGTRMVGTRLAAGTLLLTLLLGPGLLVNVVFKDNWGHARPRQVEQFGGDMSYQPPLKPAFGQDGRSFVCGHCSVGFSLLAFWFIFKRRWRRIAWAALAVGVAAGMLVGIARMGAGAHFLSDVLWSGFLVFISAWVAYYLLLGVPARAAEESITWPKRPSRRWLLAAIYISLAGIFAVVTAYRTPFRTDLTYQPSEEQLATTPTALVVTAAGMHLEVDLVAGPPGAFQVTGVARGAGTPLSRVEVEVLQPTAQDPTLTYAVVRRGTVTKLGGHLRVSVPTAFESARIAAETVQFDGPPRDVANLPRLQLESTNP